MSNEELHNLDEVETQVWSRQAFVDLGDVAFKAADHSLDVGRVELEDVD